MPKAKTFRELANRQFTVSTKGGTGTLCQRRPQERQMDFTSRFAICQPGNFFSVEDKRTGERVSTHSTYALALRAAKAASREVARKSAK